MSTVRRVARNTGFLLVGRVATKIISFFILLYIARYLGPSDFGKFSFAFAFIYFFGFIPDMGIYNILVREIAREPKLAGKLIGNATIVKLLLSAVAFLLSFLIINLMNYPIDTKNAVYIASLGLLFTSLNAFGVVYEVNLRMEYSVLFGVASRVFFLAFILLAIQHNLTLIYFVFASVTADLLHAVLMVLFSKKFVKPDFKIDYSLLKNILREALPIAITTVFVMIYFRVDIVMLSLLKNDTDVGLYSAAYRLTEAFIFIPSIFMTSMFPLLSKYYKDSSELFVYTYSKSFKYLFAAGMLLAVIITFISDKIILNVYGIEFYGSISALKILIWATAVMFVNNLFSFTYVSSGNQKVMARITSIAALANIGLNLLLIPTFSYNGAAVATLFTEASVMIFGMYWIHKNIVHTSLAKETQPIIISTFLIIIFFIALKSYINIIFLIILSILLFNGILYITGWYTIEDKKLFLNIFKK